MSSPFPSETAVRSVRGTVSVDPARDLARIAWTAHAALLAVGVVALLSFASPWAIIHGFSIDDAWIHQVVARTFAQTGTLGYAKGQFGAGATSYLWAAILACNYRFFHADPVVYTLALNVALYLGASQVLLAMILRDGLVERPAPAPVLDAIEGVLVVGLAGLGGNYIWFAFSGMEATLLVFLSAFAIFCVSARPAGSSTKYALGAGIAAGLLALTRPEAIVLGPFLAVASHRLGRSRRDTLVFVACWALGVALYFGANIVEAGTAVPATLGGRKWIWLGDSAGLPRIFVLFDFVFAWILRLRDYTLGTSSNIALWIAFALSAVGLVRLVRGRRWGLLLLAGWTVVHVGTYAVLLPTLGHGGRYQPLLPPMYLLLTGIGSIALVDDLFFSIAGVVHKPWPVWGRGLAIVAGLAPWIGLVAVGIRDWSHDYVKSVAHIRSTELGLGALVDRLPPDAVVASFDIGGIGFASHRPILDIGGLSDPRQARLLLEGKIADYLREHHVDYVAVPEEYDTNFPGSLNFALRLHLRDNPALRLRLVRSLETPIAFWLPAILATAGSAPRQALYQVEYLDAPAERVPAPVQSGGLDDRSGALSTREHALAAHNVQALADAGIRARLTLDNVLASGPGDVSDDTWWVQIAPSGVRVTVPRAVTAVTSAEATALMYDRLGGYVALQDFSGAALLAPHVLIEIIQRWVDPGAHAILSSAPRVGLVSDAQIVGRDIGVNLVFYAGVALLALFFDRRRRRRVPLSPPEAARTTAHLADADAH